jgi:hypothetical protein
MRDAAFCSEAIAASQGREIFLTNALKFDAEILSKRIVSFA